MKETKVIIGVIDLEGLEERIPGLNKVIKKENHQEEDQRRGREQKEVGNEAFLAAFKSSE